jgi:hypothetical protein
MKATTAYLTGAFLLLISLGAQADVTLHYCKDLTADQFRSAAKAGFIADKWTVEQERSSSVIGKDGSRKAEVAMTDPGTVVLRWAPGSEDNKEKHLVDLGEQVLWALATVSRPGEVTTHWCKDLTTEKFHKAALAALLKRHYSVEKDTPTSLVGAQKKYKVEITMDQPGRINVRWVPGFGYKKNNWLDNLTRDISWSLAL